MKQEFYLDSDEEKKRDKLFIDCIKGDSECPRSLMIVKGTTGDLCILKDGIIIHLNKEEVDYIRKVIK